MFLTVPEVPKKQQEYQDALNRFRKALDAYCAIVPGRLENRVSGGLMGWYPIMSWTEALQLGSVVTPRTSEPWQGWRLVIQCPERFAKVREYAKQLELQQFQSCREKLLEELHSDAARRHDTRFNRDDEWASYRLLQSLPAGMHLVEAKTQWYFQGMRLDFARRLDATLFRLAHAEPDRYRIESSTRSRTFINAEFNQYSFSWCREFSRNGSDYQFDMNGGLILHQPDEGKIWCDYHGW